MNTPKDPGRRLHALLDALAEHASSATDDELLEDAAAEGTDTKAEAGQVRNVLLEGLKRAKRQRLEHARAERERVLAALESAPVMIPSDSAGRRALLGRLVQRKPQVREAVLTVQHRDFESLSDDDVESLLKQLQHLGVLDDDAETKK